MAEAILDRVGAGKFRAYSAGSQPKGQPHPETIRLLQSLDYDTSGFRSKSWNEFARPGAPALDFVFTVCDNAAGETCPPLAWLAHCHQAAELGKYNIKQKLALSSNCHRAIIER
jgi:protein-tyrosine-phosphatase